MPALHFQVICFGVAMTTAPIFNEPETDLEPRSPPRQASIDLPDRVHRLEDEISDLRDTIARFADLMIGEVKDLRKSHGELPVFPPSIEGELPVTATKPSSDEVVPVPVESTTRRPWLLIELLRDFGATFNMYLDPRYRVRRATQVMVPVILVLFAVNCFFFRHVFTVEIVSSALEKIIDVILAVLLYKVVYREIVRYRQVLAQLSAWQHYRSKNRSVLVASEPAMTRLETD